MQLKELAFTIGDIYTAHNILDYIKPGEDRTRIIAGATLGALGYGLGPKIEETLRQTDDMSVREIAREDVLYTAGGAALGAVTGYMLGNDIASNSALEEKIKIITQEDQDPKRPGGLLTVLSAGYLGYSLLVADHDEEYTTRQRWGLGAASVGYLTGPEVLGKIKDIIIPAHAAQDATKVYQRGAAVVGGMLGAGGGLWLKHLRGGDDDRTQTDVESLQEPDRDR